MRQDAFSGYHPAVNFLYFALVLCFGMFWMHPVCVALSLSCAVAYSVYLNGRHALRSQLVIALPVVVLSGAVNVLFNHRGVTVLAYLPSGNPLTLESALYALTAAGVLLAVVSWFGCYNAVMTSDKFIYLFGRAIPALSLVLTMTFRLIPRFKAQFRAVSQAQQGLGLSDPGGTLRRRLSSAVRILSIMLTWSLENAIETADAMKSRGYGLPGRSAFSIYRLDRRDKAALGWLCVCGLFLLGCWVGGALSWRFFPSLDLTAPGAETLLAFAVYLLLCLTPLLLGLRADWLWLRARRGGAA